MPVSITESNQQGAQAVVGFAYDNRGRLIGETRTGATPYDMEYAYDQAGNRTSKLDNAAALLTLYEYDVDDPAGYQSDNNRLMKSEMYDVSGTPVLVETKWYYYVDQNGYDEGCVNRIVTRDHTLPGAPHYSAVRMEYDKALRVSFMLGEAWDEDGSDPDSCPDNFTTTWAREFRYDAARARYLNRELDPTVFVALSETWTDYDGDESYNDFEIDAGTPPTIDNLRSYEPGLSVKDPDDQSSGVSYYHSDMLGTTRTMSNSAGSTSSAVAYTAFGEKITPGYHRYGYAGSWGYQAHDFPSGENVSSIPFLHVGWRYYDPGTGRFLQRDPMGIAGGLHAYAYARNYPVGLVDPTGLHDEEQDPVAKVLKHPLVRAGGVVLCLVAVCVGAPFAVPLGFAGTAMWGGGDVYDGGKWIIDNTPPLDGLSDDGRRGKYDPPTVCCIHGGRCGTNAPGCPRALPGFPPQDPDPDNPFDRMP